MCPEPIEMTPKIIEEIPIENVIVAKGTAKYGVLYLTDRHPKRAMINIHSPTIMTGRVYLDSFFKIFKLFVVRF
jgi:hypothetical protein